MKLIVNADDFGYSTAINEGIIESHLNGIVTSATAMANMPGIEQATTLSKKHPSLGVGIHLVLTCGSPLHPHVPSLVDNEGSFQSLKNFNDNFHLDEIYEEWKLQIDRMISLGIHPTHLDSHHHVHAHEGILPVSLQLAKEYGLPLRRCSKDDSDLLKDHQTTDRFIHGFYGEEVSKDQILSLIEPFATTNQTVEIMCHPGYIDAEVFHGSSYHYQRVKELEILTDRTLREELTSLSVELVHYGHLFKE
jgi:chitin disaccharide deacetylase